MINLIRKKLNPTCYQGHNKRPHHFEGWYFKIIDHEKQNMYAIIPGVFINNNTHNSHSFIQIFDGNSAQTFYNKFPVEDFFSKKNTFDIRINSNHFSATNLVLDIKNTNIHVKGELDFTQLTPWPITLLSPGIMGWYAWVPFMECYHGIVSLDHDIRGSLSVNGQKTDFSGGKGYSEKDWGTSFPEAWVWCQSNHFQSQNTSFTGSVAIIPWIRRPFLGFIMGLWHKNKLYRFTTYTGAKLIEFHIEESKVHWIVQQKKYVLEITAHRSKGSILQAPSFDGMTTEILESLKGTLEITLSRVTSTGRFMILHDIGHHAGVEVAGNLERIKEMYEKQVNC